MKKKIILAYFAGFVSAIALLVVIAFVREVENDKVYFDQPIEMNQCRKLRVIQVLPPDGDALVTMDFGSVALLNNDGRNRYYDGQEIVVFDKYSGVYNKIEQIGTYAYQNKGGHSATVPIIWLLEMGESTDSDRQ